MLVALLILLMPSLSQRALAAPVPGVEAQITLALVEQDNSWKEAIHSNSRSSVSGVLRLSAVNTQKEAKFSRKVKVDPTFKVSEITALLEQLDKMGIKL